MQQGLIVLVVGITTVFAFLVLLVVVMQASTRFFEKFAYLFPEPEQDASAAENLAEIAVALAAVRAHKR